MKIWITGIAGFLGSHLEEALTKEGHDVLGNDSGVCSSQPISPLNKFDCCDFSRMKSWIGDSAIDVLIHCAATAHEGLSNFSPSFITKNIYEASVATFSAAIASGVKRIIFMSSMARYGKQELPFTEDMRPMPVDPYGIAKVAAEETLKTLCNLHGVEYVILVPHNIIGERQRYNDPFRNVASIMINRTLQGLPIIIYGDGNQKRCFSPIKDCLHSLVKAVDAPISGEVINIGPDGGEITINQLGMIVAETCSDTFRPQYFPDRPNEVKNAWCSSDKARRFLDYKPQHHIRDCIADMVGYIRKNGVKPFDYSFPIEIVTEKTPRTWKDKLI